MNDEQIDLVENLYLLELEGYIEVLIDEGEEYLLENEMETFEDDNPAEILL